VLALGITTYEYLRVSRLGFALLLVLCIAGLIGVGFAAHRLLRDRFEDYERGGLTWAGYAALAAILIAIVVLLAVNVNNETPAQTAEQIRSESSAGTGNPWLQAQRNNPWAAP
jgi:NhaP-type Na+/H+ or K+/H+ antiporter